MVAALPTAGVGRASRESQHRLARSADRAASSSEGRRSYPQGVRGAAAAGRGALAGAADRWRVHPGDRHPLARPMGPVPRRPARPWRAADERVIRGLQRLPIRARLYRPDRCGRPDPGRGRPPSRGLAGAHRHLAGLAVPLGHPGHAATLTSARSGPRCPRTGTAGGRGVGVRVATCRPSSDRTRDRPGSIPRWRIRRSRWRPPCRGWPHSDWSSSWSRTATG